MKTTELKTNKIKLQRGASLVEYCLLLSLIAFVCITSLSYVGKNINGSLTEVAFHLGHNIQDGGGTEIGGGGPGGGGK